MSDSMGTRQRKVTTVPSVDRRLGTTCSRRSTRSDGGEGFPQSDRYSVSMQHPDVQANARLGLYVSPRIMTTPDGNCVQRALGRVFGSQRYEMFCGTLILVNFWIMVLETDARARSADMVDDPPADHSLSVMMDVISVLNSMFSFVFAIELLAKMYALRLFFWHNGWNILDVVIVFCDGASFLAEICVPRQSDVFEMSYLRSLRMVRLLRLSRVLVSFPELYNLVCGLTRCMRTLMWAGGLLTVTCTVWSIVAVEFIHPLMPPLVAAQHYDTCGWCPTGFRSIFFANLTFFQIVSGDGWSSIARPIIEAHPWTAAVFVSVIFVVVFGLLNLVIAAIVEASVQARESDVATLSMRVEAEQEETWRNFREMCEQLDDDANGEIDFDEFVAGVEKNPLLKAYMTVMGVEAKQFEQMFFLLDEDGSGNLSYMELSQQLFEMKVMQVKPTLFYVLKYVQELQRQMDTMHKRFCDDVSFLKFFVEESNPGAAQHAMEKLKQHAEAAASDRTKHGTSLFESGFANDTDFGFPSQRALSTIEMRSSILRDEAMLGAQGKHDASIEGTDQTLRSSQCATEAMLEAQGKRVASREVVNQTLRSSQCVTEAAQVLITETLLAHKLADFPSPGSTQSSEHRSCAQGEVLCLLAQIQGICVLLGDRLKSMDAVDDETTDRIVRELQDFQKASSMPTVLKGIASGALSRDATNPHQLDSEKPDVLGETRNSDWRGRKAGHEKIFAGQDTDAVFRDVQAPLHSSL